MMQHHGLTKQNLFFLWEEEGKGEGKRVRPEAFYFIHINVPFVFQPSSHLVLNLFTSRFQYVPIMFPVCS